MRVLVVDKDPVIAEFLDSNLDRLSYDVSTTNSGVDALERMHSDLVRVIICGATEISGEELCRQVRALPALDSTHLILLTRNESSARRHPIADQLLRCPVEVSQLEYCLQIAERDLALRTRELAIFSLANLAESRDPESGSHLMRIREYCRTLANQLKQSEEYSDIVDDEYVRLIYLTSPLHDIGKVGIPDGVLLKPGPLTETEFDIMKRHARIGADTLDSLVSQNPDARYLRMARDIALSHHEKFDGSGYPNGLIGSDIPLCGRIVALADVYDALTTKRVYKPAYSHEVARSIILDGRGKHFDPDVVRAFVDTESEFVEIKERLTPEAHADEDSFCTEALLSQ